MQTDKARKLREQWGNKPCDHESVVKEYDRGAATGDYVCTQCGRAGWGSDWNSKIKKDSKS
jgi:uncharacterized protein with PIN domain